jgi:hypothetical protein
LFAKSRFLPDAFSRADQLFPVCRKKHRSRCEEETGRVRERHLIKVKFSISNKKLCITINFHIELKKE